jgi:hypothetical protein
MRYDDHNSLRHYYVGLSKKISGEKSS